ncbi:C-C motif chemokine 14-like [Hippopotamus amphibius kiboko]|uniref:C-C motif chemokine 14-like n=1 Tax=Hippopotamus amphibius kiboko TaxID=575201 RepID=UPI002597622A|nr:C-C motif chemokine 14-like [Hippopotamus amphibius kiboko]
MKVSMAAISLLLLLLPLPLVITVTLGSDTETYSGVPYHPSECCFNYATRVVPRQRILSYYETGSQCSKPGIIFITKKHRVICAKPSDDWVQDYIKELEDI